MSTFTKQSGYALAKNQWYCESAWSVEALLAVEKFEGDILDPCCGSGNIPRVCQAHGYEAFGSDIEDRGFGPVRDVFAITERVANIVTNPPYGKMAEQVLRHCLHLARRKVAAILPFSFWESVGRQDFFDKHPPARWYPFASRVSMPPGQHGMLVQPEGKGGTQCYGWLVWDRSYTGPTTIPCRLYRPHTSYA